MLVPAGARRWMVGAFAALLLLAAPQTLAAQGSSQERAATSRGAAAEDENIRVQSGVNDKSRPSEPAPAEKAPAGTRSRGANECRVQFDNRSSLFVATYAEGAYRGELPPWGDVYTFVIAGQARLYARATYTDGSVSTWGPRLVECPAGGTYKWMLFP